MEKIIISVGRQLGSGGRTVARMLAKEFECKLYDREILNLAARESGFKEKFFEQNDERRGFLKSLFHLHVPFVGDNNFYANRFSQEGLFQLQCDAITKAAEESSCVFVGRCAEYVLRDRTDMVSVFITADLADRIERVGERHGCDNDTARKMILNGESERAAYYNYYTGKKWGHSSSYDLCVNSSRLGMEGTAQFIADYIRKVKG